MDTTTKKRISTKEGATDDPPAFEEMMRTPAVFFMFMSYLVDQLATENLFFLQFVRLYRLMKRPQQEIDAFGRMIMCTFCLPGSPSEVNISSETRDSLCQAYLQPCLRTGGGEYGTSETSSVYTPVLFDTAYSEIHSLSAERYTAWLATNEWKKREVLNSMRRLQPPSFSTVLGNQTLCSLFLNYLREKVAPDSDELDSFLFCVDAEKLRLASFGGNQAQAIKQVPESRPRKMSDASAVFITVSVPQSSSQELQGNTSDGETQSESRFRRASEAVKPKDEDLIMGPSESVNLEKMARQIVKKHRFPKKSKQLSYRLHVSAQYDRFVCQWAKNDLFVQWQKSKQWANVSFKESVTLRQSKDSAGMLEFPTLPATLMSLLTDPHRNGNGIGTLFRYIMNFSSYPKDLEFLEAVLKFRKKYSAENADKDDMVDAAKTIFNTYIIPVKVGEVLPHSPCAQFLNSSLTPTSPRPGSPSPHGSPLMSATDPVVEAPLVPLDNNIVNEIRSILWSSAKTKVHCHMFRRAGTFVFRRAQNTWFRELCASYIWLGREYENNSEQNDKIMEYFGDYSIIDNVVENQPVPLLYDDILENPNLYMKFLAVVPSTRKPILDVLDRISAFRMKPVQTLREARAVRSALKDSKVDNLVVLKLIKNMKSYLVLESIAAPFAGDGNCTPPTEGTALVSNAIFDFIRSSLHRQLMNECGEKFIAQRTSKKISSPAPIIHFFKYVDPLHEIEVALVTKLLPVAATQSQCSVVHSAATSKSSSSSSGVRTPLLSVVPALLDGTGMDVDDPPASKRNSLFGFLRQKQRHSPLVRHIRAPGSSDSPVTRSPDIVTSSPKVFDSDPIQSTSQASSDGILMNVPSFDEVLGSTYFRQMLTDCYFGRVDEDEANAWDDLTRFYSKFCRIDDSTLARSQDAAVKHAKNVIEANREFLSKSADQLEKALSSRDRITVTANFFRKVEKDVFSKAYDAFVQYLTQNGWRIVPVAVESDDDLMFM